MCTGAAIEQRNASDRVALPCIALPCLALPRRVLGPRSSWLLWLSVLLVAKVCGNVAVDDMKYGNGREPVSPLSVSLQHPQHPCSLSVWSSHSRQRAAAVLPSCFLQQIQIICKYRTVPLPSFTTTYECTVFVDNIEGTSVCPTHFHAFSFLGL